MAGGLGATAAANLTKLIFQATAWALVADNAASTPLTAIFLTLHTASPSGGTQSTSAAAYTSYVYKSVTRASGSGGFTQSSATMNLTDLTSFVAATGGSETETHFGAGQSSSGSGILIIWGTLTPNIVVSNGVTPQITTATMLTWTT
jgi:hypothetical protein